MIEQGDIVMVAWKNLPLEKAEILRTPRGEGDLWQIRYIISNIEQAINPYSDEFICFQKQGGE